ncbi:MAG: hypothetical protein M1434_10610 [Chloroflexi bacterium]|nr:hypothetical protein [Chloroflexota bacterium]MCL5275178.1 hypothetical protein [Chloroflexota bacterium]
MVNPVAAPDAACANLIERHAFWWRREEMLLTIVDGSPLGDLWLPLADKTLAADDMDITPDALDLDRLAGPLRNPGNPAIKGDLFEVVDPYGKIPWVEAILGSPIHATIRGGSMRTRSCIDSWDAWNSQPSHCEEKWFRFLLRLTDLLAQRSSNCVAVVQPTMRGPADLAEALLGPLLMCYSMYDDPAALRHFLVEVTDTFIAVLTELLSIIPTVAGGYISPFGIWAPGTVVRTQCDATAFLSATQYVDWFLPHDLYICRAFDYSFMHLHSCSLHTVGALLMQEHPHAIQVTLESEPKGPALETLLPIFTQILKVKPLLLEGKLNADQINRLQQELPTGGLAITARTNEW